MTPEFVMVAIIIELFLLIAEFIVFFQNNHKKDLTNHSKYDIIYTEKKKERNGKAVK